MLEHITDDIVDTPKQYPSILHGPAFPPLVSMTLGSFLDLQCTRFGDRECIVTPWTGDRWTYNRLRSESIALARYLHSRGIRAGDRIAILAGNRAEYAAVLFAAMRVGAILVILNNTYTTKEAEYALSYSECKILFATTTIGRLDNTPTLDHIRLNTGAVSSLRQIILLSGALGDLLSYDDAVSVGKRLPQDLLDHVEATFSPFDTCNLQFTSGSTGNPKAAMLTHHGLLNNSRFIGGRMQLTPDDVLCCPPPLFHCFGLVLGLLAVISHGAKIVYPAEVFDGPAVLQAITDERCTALHGVPAMFDTLFSLPRPAHFDCSRLRTGIIAGAPVPRYLMELLVNEFGMTEFTSSYGLTEASPTCFNAYTDDSIDRRLSTVGTLMPHASAKLVDKQGRVVPIGARGELCIAGYQLSKGYWRNAGKTAEALRRDENGVLWLHTGDEAVFDHDGYCSITGRFKDIIIRGGENVYPLEIEERLVQHPAVDRAIVVGISHQRYGEVVGAFLQRTAEAKRPDDAELQAWTRETLGRHKAPVHIFWLGEDGVTSNLPLTGSGKIKKYEMKRIAEELVGLQVQAKL